MAININTKELFTVMESTPAEQNIMLSGKHGIGKSQIITKFFEEKGFRVVTLFLGQMSDPGDLIGLPRMDEKTGKTEFMPPYWFPTDGKPIVLFLDELNRARPEVLQTIMDLALNRKLAGRSLPAGSRIMSAVNDGEEYQLTDLDPALVSRFNIYGFRPTVEEWLKWGEKNDLDSRILGFIRSNKDALDGKELSKVSHGLDKTPDRRGWEKVSDCIKPFRDLGEIHKKLVAGIIGAQSASLFFSYLAEHVLLSADKILTNFKKCKDTLSTYSTVDLAAINESIFRFFDNMEPNDTQKETYKKNLKAYVNDFLLVENTEAMAHFASMFEENDHGKAIMFFVTEMPEIYVTITDFIKNI